MSSPNPHPSSLIPHPSAGPAISVVIPLYKASGYLPALLSHLERQTLSHDQFEVVLVDDCSPDDTRLVAQQLKSSSPLNLQLVWREENGGVSAARNSGWQAAHAPLILFIDQDCLADPHLLASHQQAHAQQPHCAIVGRIVWSSDYQENPASQYFKVGYFPSWDSYDPARPNFHLFITSNASVSKAGLAAAGGFDEPFRHNYEDITCGYRLEVRADYKVVLCHEALVYHHRPLPVEEMFRRNFVAGREMTRLFRHYPALLSHFFMLNPAQSLDWGYRLATAESMLAETLQNLDAADLKTLAPLLEQAGRYLLTHPFFHFVDSDYVAALLTQRSYQDDLDKVRWQEAGLGERSKVEPTGQPFGQSKKSKALNNYSVDTLHPSSLIPHPSPSPLPFSVLTVLDETAGLIEWQHFLQSLSEQTVGHDDFELIVGVTPQTASLVGGAETGQFTMRVVEVKTARQGWQAVAQAARGELLVLLAADSQAQPDLLDAYGTQHRRNSGAVLVGQELPLPRHHLETDEQPPQMTVLLPQADLKQLHFTSLQLLNLAIPRQVYGALKGLFELPLGGKLAGLVAGWQLDHNGIELQSQPSALSYASQTRRLAQQMLDLLDYEEQLTLVQNYYPNIAILYRATRRPPQKSSLHLLYDTLKEYPLSQGMRQGLLDNFSIKNYAELRAHPLFSHLVEQWEQERRAYFQSRLADLHDGQTELNDYARQVENALHEPKASRSKFPFFKF